MLAQTVGTVLGGLALLLSAKAGGLLGSMDWGAVIRAAIPVLLFAGGGAVLARSLHF